MKRAPAAVLLAVAVLAAPGCGGSGVTAVGEPHVNAFPKGQPLAGNVLVVELPGGEVRICGNQTSDLMFGPPACPSGPRTVGVRTDALQQQSSKSAERWGYLYLVGSYRKGTFYVTSQSPHGPSTQPAGSSSFAKPPCPAPPGGWLLTARTQAQQKSLDRYSMLAGHHDLVDIAFFDRGSILTVASTHPARTRVVLGPFWHRQLCVVRARYSRTFMNRVRTRMVRLMKSTSRAAEYGWMSGAGGSSVNDRGQPTTPIEVLLETPQLRALLQRLPRGLVVVQAALRPFGYA